MGSQCYDPGRIEVERILLLNGQSYEDLPADSPIRTYAEKNNLSPEAKEELLTLVMKMIIRFEMLEELGVLDPGGLEDDGKTIH